MNQGIERLQHASSFKLGFSEKVTRDELFASLDRLLEISGCPTCGLNGHDWHIRVINPEFERVTRVLLEGKGPLINVEVMDKSLQRF